MMVENISNQAKEAMIKGVESLFNNLSRLRTGRASLTILDGIKVDYYGTMTPINQVATLSVPEPRLIVIQPWEATIIKEIEKSIERSNIGLNPTNDGKVIRLPIPQLTEERRKDIVKQLKSMAEDSRVTVRKARKDANDQLKQLEKAKEISEDDLKRGSDLVQKITDEHIKKIDEASNKKEQDIMTV
ncbi:ribosome recycling factor [bacterium K02(2017)]|nr:ribosome recycling factor [bacterium K02(2017)]